jgi:ribosomal RNA-processing protein 36
MFLFDKNNSIHIFLYMQRLQKMIKKSKDPNAIEEMKSRVTWIVCSTS